MADVTLDVAPYFPAGTTLYAFRFISDNPDGVPAPVTQDASSTVSNNGQVAFTGLTGGASYWIGTNQNPYNFIGATTPASTPTSGVSGVAGQAFKATTAYKAGDLITQNGVAYFANADFTSGVTFSAANWTVVNATALAPIPFPGRPVASNGFLGAAASLSDGVFTGSNARFRHKAHVDMGLCRLVYVNGYNGTNGSDSIVVKASAEPTSGVFLRVYFDGVNSITIPPGGVAISDPIPLDVAAGSTFYTRTFVSVTAGQKWPKYRYANSLGAWSEGVTASNGETDKTFTGSVTGGTEYGFGPYLIVSQEPAAQNAKAVALIGDSIMVGSNNGDSGFMVQALNDAFPFVQTGSVGEQIQSYLLRSTTPFRKAIIAGCTTAVMEYGINDIATGNRTAAQLEADWLTVATYMSRRGMRVFQCTITPKTSSTDSWATTANQTPMTQDAVRIAVNTWLRAGAPIDPTTKAAVAVGTSGALLAGSIGHPIYGMFDTAAKVEVDASNTITLNGGLWKVGYTTDGLHPGASAHAQMGTAVDTSRFG